MWLAQPGASTEGSKLDHPEPPKSASPGSKMGSWRSPPKSSLGGSAAPPQRRQESFREDILGATFATHARSMRNDETWFKNQHVWSALNRFRIDPGSLQIDHGTRILTRDRTRRWTAGPANLWLCYGLLSRSSERAPGLVSCREVPMGRQNLRARFRTSFSVNGFFPRRNQKINSILLRSLHCSPHVAIRPHNKLCRLIALVPTI